MPSENTPPMHMHGYDHGDDKKLQEAMLANLKKNKEEHAISDPEMAKRIHEDIEALEAHMQNDEKEDPNHEFPDDLHVGRQEKL